MERERTRKAERRTSARHMSTEITAVPFLRSRHYSSAAKTLPMIYSIHIAGLVTLFNQRSREKTKVDPDFARRSRRVP